MVKCKSTSLLKMLKKKNNSSGIKPAVRCLNSKEFNKVGLAELNVSLIDVLVECPFCNKLMPLTWSLFSNWMNRIEWGCKVCSIFTAALLCEGNGLKVIYVVKLNYLQLQNLEIVGQSKHNLGCVLYHELPSSPVLSTQDSGTMVLSWAWNTHFNSCFDTNWIYLHNLFYISVKLQYKGTLLIPIY